MPNIRDVAKLAGVSPASVSRILNHDETYKVPEATIKKVFDAAKKLHYTIPKNSHSKSKKIKIGIINRLTEEHTKDHYYSSILKSIVEVCKKKNIEVEILQSQFALNDTNTLNLFLATQINGIIIMGETSPEIIKTFLNRGIQVVGIDTHSPLIDNVRYDRYQAGCLAMNYLISNGHTKIAYIGSRLPIKNTYDLGRHDAYLNMMRTNNLPVYPEWIIDCKWNRNVCYNKVKELINTENRPTAIFVASDHMAIAAISSITNENLRIPEDISIIGITDIESSQYLSPPLTTVKIPQNEMGIIATNTLLQKIQNNDTIIKEIFLPTTLVIRKSVKKLK